MIIDLGNSFKFLWKIILGLKFLNERVRIAHGSMYFTLETKKYSFTWNKYSFKNKDLKPSNILLNRDGLIKLSDFGLYKEVVANVRPGQPDYQPVGFLIQILFLWTNTNYFLVYKSITVAVAIKACHITQTCGVWALSCTSSSWAAIPTRPAARTNSKRSCERMATQALEIIDESRRRVSPMLIMRRSFETATCRLFHPLTLEEPLSILLRNA